MMMDTRQKILTYACQQFLAIGIRNVTMDALASELAVSKRTIYELFGDKTSLVIESLRFMILENNKELIGIIQSADNVVEALFMIVRQQKEKRKEYPVVFIEDLKKYFPMVHASFYSRKDDLKKFSAFFTLLEKGMKEGVFRNDLKIELVDNFIHEAISIVHTSERIRLLTPCDREVINSIFLPYFRGICTQKGLDLMKTYFEERHDPEQYEE